MTEVSAADTVPHAPAAPDLRAALPCTAPMSMIAVLAYAAPPFTIVADKALSRVEHGH